MAAEASEKCEGTRLSPWKCVSWREVRNSGAVVPLSASRSLCVRVKGNKMRGRWEGGGTEEAVECRGRRTTPGEDTLQECGAPHALLTRAREKPKWKSLGRAAQPVLALTCVLTDVNTVNQNQANRICVAGTGVYTVYSTLHRQIRKL